MNRLSSRKWYITPFILVLWKQRQVMGAQATVVYAVFKDNWCYIIERSWFTKRNKQTNGNRRKPHVWKELKHVDLIPTLLVLSLGSWIRNIYLYLMSLLSLRDAATFLHQMSMDIQEASPLPLVWILCISWGMFCWTYIASLLHYYWTSWSIGSKRGWVCPGLLDL